MQQPTLTGVRVRSVRDAHIIFHAVYSRLLPIVNRRLDADERRAVRAGNVYVWEERGRNADASSLGIERWTDGIRWSASRVRDEFLLYHERDDENSDADGNPYAANHRLHHPRLVKQTYSVLVETPEGRRKWHMTAYFTPATVDQLRTIMNIPFLATLSVPEGMYSSAKMGKSRARDEWIPPDSHVAAAAAAASYQDSSSPNPHLYAGGPPVGLTYPGYHHQPPYMLPSPSSPHSPGMSPMGTSPPHMAPLRVSPRTSPPMMATSSGMPMTPVTPGGMLPSRGHSLPIPVPSSGHSGSSRGSVPSMSGSSPSSGDGSLQYRPRHPVDVAALRSLGGPS